MKESDFYRRAAADAAFRKEKLDDLRYYKNVGAGLMWFCGILAVAFSLYGGFTAGKWSQGLDLFYVVALTACTYASCRTRIAALEALDTPEV